MTDGGLGGGDGVVQVAMPKQSTTTSGVCATNRAHVFMFRFVVRLVKVESQAEVGRQLRPKLQLVA